MRLRILNAEPKDYSRQAFEILSTVGKIKETSLTQESIIDELEDIDALIVRLGVHVTKKVLDSAPRLKYVISATTGTDHIDVQECEARSIRVICLKNEQEFLRTIPSTSEHTWGLLLSLLRKTPFAFDSVRKGEWSRQEFRGNNLLGKTVGILGLGRIGQHVARYALAFGCKVIAYDPSPLSWVEGVKRKSSVEKLLSSSEILLIHIPFDDNTKQYLNQEKLTLLPHGAVVINTSRSGVWDEVAVLDMLQSGRLGAVATDVLSGEQDGISLVNHPMIVYAKSAKNLLITPHIGGATLESMHMTEEFIAEKFVKVLEGDLRS